MATKTVNVVVTVGDAHVAAMKPVVDALKSAGLKISGQMNTLGIISGAVAQADLGALKKIPGVADVELDEEMTIQE